MVFAQVAVARLTWPDMMRDQSIKRVDAEGRI
jgi:hypothetical protein